MKGSSDYYVTVIEDTIKNEIIGSATLVIEHKFIHECGLVRKYINFLSRNKLHIYNNANMCFLILFLLESSSRGCRSEWHI